MCANLKKSACKFARINSTHVRRVPPNEGLYLPLGARSFTSFCSCFTSALSFSLAFARSLSSSLFNALSSFVAYVPIVNWLDSRDTALRAILGLIRGGLAAGPRSVTTYFFASRTDIEDANA